jgi:putative PIN family toxin of toxin-antitoxin system
VKKVVLDTNVTISALFWEGNPRKVYDLVRHGKLIMLLSDDMEKEFIRVLGYGKFGLSPQEVMPFVRNLRTHSKVKAKGRWSARPCASSSSKVSNGI